MKTLNNKPPRIGQPCTVRGAKATVRRVYDFGTMDVEVVSTGKLFRVTGLAWLKAEVK